MPVTPLHRDGCTESTNGSLCCRWWWSVHLSPTRPICSLRHHGPWHLADTAQGFLRCRGAALDWLQSYLTHRMKCVRCGSDRSTLTTIWFGVPQGSVLGPLLFILYTAGLIDLIKGHGLRPHLYADDMQIQGSCHPGSVTQLQSTVSTCLDDVSDWMRTNRLQLNTLKTEIFWCTTSHRQHCLSTTPVRVGADHVLPSTKVRDLGIFIDSDVTMRSHVTRTVSGCPQHQTFSARLRVPDVGRCACYATPRLWQRDTSGTPCVPVSSTPVSSQCCSQADTQVTSLWAHYTSTPRPPLAAVSGAHRFQVSRACLFIDVYMVLLLSTYLITSNMLPFPIVDDFVHRRHRCYWFDEHDS